VFLAVRCWRNRSGDGTRRDEGASDRDTYFPISGGEFVSILIWRIVSNLYFIVFAMFRCRHLFDKSLDSLETMFKIYSVFSAMESGDLVHLCFTNLLHLRLFLQIGCLQ
jgi:hypothetical protein